MTNENKDLYLQQRLRHRMFDSIRVQLQEMLKGIYEVSVLVLVNPNCLLLIERSIAINR